MPDPRRLPLVLLPTPLHRLDRLSNDLGLDLWIKRDDLTGFALGGNKGRKLEFLMADVLDSGADTVVCCGAIQSNFIRQLGAACSMYGLRCVAAVMEAPYYSAAGKAKSPVVGGRNANQRLDAMLDVEVHRIDDGPWEALYEFQERLAADISRESGKSAYVMPIGGSSLLGAYSFVLAGREIESQTDPFDVLVTPSSSGSTHSGLAWQFAGSSTRVVGISADPDPDNELVEDMVELAKGLDELLGSPRELQSRQFDLRMDWVGEGYGVPSKEGEEAIRLMARREGIFLDPVYTGKAFAGLLAMARRREIGGRVLFWHTGGVPVLFAD